MRGHGFAALGLLAAALVGGCGGTPAPGFVSVEAEKARELIEAAELVIVDVSSQWAEGHIPGAKDLPLADGALRRALPTLDKQRPHLVCAHDEEDSVAGARLLGGAGVLNVYRLAGNFAAWRHAGYPVERPVVDVDAHGAAELMRFDRALVVVDVSPHWDDGHIPGAKNHAVSGGWLEIALSSLDPRRPHLVYARTDDASVAGAEFLAARGFRVYRLVGNFAAWQDAGYPVALPKPAVFSLDAEEVQIIIMTTPPLVAIDVSTRWEEGHIPGAKNYPMEDGVFTRAMRTFDKRRPYLVYGHASDASIEAAWLLVDQGFSPVYWLEGGFQAWVDAGYPVGLPEASVHALSAVGAQRLTDEQPGLVILDVSSAWAEGHLPGAKSMPLASGALDRALSTMNRSLPYLVYDHGGDEGLVGASRLVFAGFSRVYWLQGGLPAWIAAGFPTDDAP